MIDFIDFFDQMAPELKICLHQKNPIRTAHRPLVFHLGSYTTPTSPNLLCREINDLKHF